MSSAAKVRPADEGFKCASLRQWQIAQNFGDIPADIESGRIHLAHAILIVARTDSRDPKRLKTEALQVMALAYKGLGGG